MIAKNKAGLDRESPIDSAALAASSLAAVIAISEQTGPYVSINLVTGITLLSIVLAFELRRERDWPKSMALGMCLGLCSWLIIGYAAEEILNALDVSKRLRDGSLVQYWHLNFAWVSLAVIFFVWDQRFYQRRRTSQ